MPSNMEILIAGLDDCHIFELKGSVTDSTAWNTGKAFVLLVQSVT